MAASKPSSPRKRIELAIEGSLFMSRWLLVPFYAGLGLAIIVLLVRFCREFVHVVGLALSGSEADILVGVLSLVDVTLTGSLLVIVIFSGYENFVSRIDPEEHQDWPAWLARVDFAGLKLKLLSSIVAISAIQLLKQFMAVSTTSDRNLMWSVLIHMVFVTSSVLLALSDRIASGSGHPAPSEISKHPPAA